ncbi:MAG TPA: hypothetical protein VII57_02140 [Dehalococcoidia bacterium]
MADDPDASAHNSDRLAAIIAELARDIWRLHSTVARLSQSGEAMPEALAALVERLQEDLTISGIELIEPTGQPYDKNSTFEIAFVAGGQGDLFISETITPGVRIGGKLVAKPKVALAAREKHP